LARKLTARDLDRAYQRFGELVQEGLFPGGVLAVGTSEGLLRNEAFGATDGTPVRPDDVYLVFSTTKPIVGTAMMQLWERGYIDLAAPVAHYWPEFGSNGKDKIKIWHLLTHTSGMGLPPAPPDYLVHLPTPEELTQVILNYTISHFTPGTCREYNSEAFWVMARLAEKVTGMPFTQYFQENVLDPLGMKDTSFDINHYPRERIQPIVEPVVDLVQYSRLQHPGAGLFSTAEDLCRFGQAFLTEGRVGEYQLLSPATIEVMTSRHTEGLPIHPDTPWMDVVDGGLTWKIPRHRRYEEMAVDGFYHDGAAGCLLFVSPKWDVCLALMTNKSGVPFHTVENLVLGCLRA